MAFTNQRFEHIEDVGVRAVFGTEIGRKRSCRFVQRGFGIRCLGGVDGELVVTGLDSAVFGDCCGDGQLLRPGVRQGDDASAGEERAVA